MLDYANQVWLSRNKEDHICETKNIFYNLIPGQNVKNNKKTVHVHKSTEFVKFQPKMAAID